MKKLTKIQIATITLVILYLIWEVVVQIWEQSQPAIGPVIRADLILIYPVLAVMILLSLIQFIIKMLRK